MRLVSTLKASLVALTTSSMYMGGHVEAIMTQSPLQVTMSSETLHDIINSAGVEIFQVFDNILVDDMQIKSAEGESYSVTGLRLTSAH